MKLPEPYNLYRHNETINELCANATLLALEQVKPINVFDICDDNLALLKKIIVATVNLELVLDEIKKLNYEQQ